MTNPFTSQIHTDGLAAGNNGHDMSLSDGPFVASPLKAQIGGSNVDPTRPVSGVSPEADAGSTQPVRAASLPARNHQTGSSSPYLAVPHHAATIGSTNELDAGASESSTPSTRVPSSSSLAAADVDDAEQKGYGNSYAPGYAQLPPSSAGPNSAFRVAPISSALRAQDGWPNERLTHLQRIKRKFETRRYEPPTYAALAAHIFLCLLAYPLLFLTALAASGKTLFWSRLVVGVGCGVVGMSLGVSLLTFARKHLEACAWATVIHESIPPEGMNSVDASSTAPLQPIQAGTNTHPASPPPSRPAKRLSTWLPRSPNAPIAPVTPDSLQSDAPGVKLSDLAARSADSASPVVALNVLRARWRLWRTRKATRGGKKGKDGDNIAKDNYGWSNHIVFFLSLITLAGMMSFIFGRLVTIETSIQHSLDQWDEVPVYGDLSEADIANSLTLLSTFQTFIQTWTLAPFASLTALPQAAAFQFEPLNSTVYFAEAYPAQLRADGSALGTYSYDAAASLSEGVRQPQLNASFLQGGRAGGSRADDGDGEGVLVQFPKWGIRIECELLTDMTKYFIPVSNDSFTYIFVPKFLVDGLFTKLSIAPPALTPANLTRFISANDSLPAGTDANEIVFIRRFLQNGVAHSFASGPAGPNDGSGFYQIELHLVRLNQALAPKGSFPITGTTPVDPVNPEGSFVGYDAAVCVEVYEPWIVEAFNSTSGVLPLTTRIIGRGNEMLDESTDSMASGAPGAKRREKLGDVARKLSSEGKFDTFAIAHDNSVNQMVKDNGRDQDYVPSPTVVSWTDGLGPQGYTKLDPQRVAVARALCDSTNVLPYLAGTKQLVARRYRDQTLAHAQLIPWITILILGIVLLMGCAAGVTVPRLPFGVPQRGFDLMSWLAVLYGDGMVGHMPEDRRRPGALGMDSTPALEEKMPLREVEKRMGEMKVRYVL